MTIIGLIDVLSFILLFVALMAIFIRRKRNRIHRDIILLIGGLIILTSGYIIFMVIEWMNINHQLEQIENILGASLPMLWAFVFYFFIQKRTMEELSINREDLQITLNSIGDAVIATDVTGRITRLNKAAEMITGFSESNALTRKIDEIITLIDPKSKKKMPNPVSMVLETGKTVKPGNQAMLQGKNNTYFYVSDNAAPIFNDNQEICGVVVVFSDMTEQFMQEEKIRTSEERLKLALSATRAGLWDWYPAENKAVYNEAWTAIIGYTLDELKPITPDTWRRRIHPEDLIKLEELIEQHIQGVIENVDHEHRLLHKNGSYIWVMSKGMIVQRDARGNPLRLTGTTIDISAQKKFEFDLKTQIEENIALNEEYLAQNEELSESIERIRKINEELEEAKEKAEESYRLKSAFLANMSHELRTPMNGIIGFSELLKDSRLTRDRRLYYAGIVIDSSKQLLTIVNDILDMSRMETGKMTLCFEEVIINDLLNVLHAFFEPQVNKKQIAFSISKPVSNKQSTVITDRTRLRQVLTNLLNNALKFTEAGSIDVGYRLIDGFLEFYVMDTGIGIPEEMHEKIYEPFRQGNFEITNRYGGTGLGLSISKKLVEMLGGKMWLTSSIGKGSTFYFTLPYNLPEKVEVKKDDDLNQLNLKEYNMIALVVEDDEVNYLFLETVLAKNKIKTIRAFNGVEAVEKCTNNKEIKLVLMDIKLPVMNGYEATRRIKKIRPGLPIIAQTAYAMHEDKHKALEAGCDGYISKPIVTDELFKLIDSIEKEK